VLKEDRFSTKWEKWALKNAVLDRKLCYRRTVLKEEGLYFAFLYFYSKTKLSFSKNISLNQLAFAALKNENTM